MRKDVIIWWICVVLRIIDFYYNFFSWDLMFDSNDFTNYIFELSIKSNTSLDLTTSLLPSSFFSSPNPTCLKPYSSPHSFFYYLMIDPYPSNRQKIYAWNYQISISLIYLINVLEFAYKLQNANYSLLFIDDPNIINIIKMESNNSNILLT
jgi:hypothetical protein